MGWEEMRDVVMKNPYISGMNLHNRHIMMMII